jgi:hypothetical protein
MSTSDSEPSPRSARAEPDEPRLDRAVLTLREAMLADTLSELVKQHQTILATEQRLIALHDKMAALADTIQTRTDRYGETIAAINHAGMARYTTSLADQTHALLRELIQFLKQRAAAESAESQCATSGESPQAGARPVEDPTRSSARSTTQSPAPSARESRWTRGRWALFSGLGLLTVSMGIAGFMNI